MAGARGEPWFSSPVERGWAGQSMMTEWKTAQGTEKLLVPGNNSTLEKAEPAWE